MTTATLDRKYAMTRMRGAWLLPSNDGQTLWRISRYREDGSAEWHQGQPILGTFWQTAKRPMPTPDEIERFDGTEDEFLWWDDAWEFHSDLHKTRADAIRQALLA